MTPQFIRTIPAAAALVLLPACPSSSAAAPAVPRVEILYPHGGSLLDRVCVNEFHVPVDSEDVQAAVEKRQAFQDEWNAQGPAYMNAALSEIGIPFPYAEVQATLTVCLRESTSVPLILEVREFLPTAKTQAPAWEFSEILFHELMHTYVSPALAHSALMEKYRNEPPTTKYHLHVMAIEKMVLLELGRPDELKAIDRGYRDASDPGYKRAWEIVNDIEGYQPFIAELKAFAKLAPAGRTGG